MSTHMSTGKCGRNLPKVMGIRIVVENRASVVAVIFFGAACGCASLRRWFRRSRESLFDLDGDHKPAIVSLFDVESKDLVKITQFHSLLRSSDASDFQFRPSVDSSRNI
jgi:hypothetical protein